MRVLTRIAVGFEASPSGRDAVALAELLARTVGAELLAVRVEHDGRDEAESRARLEAELASALPPTPVRVRAVTVAGKSVPKALAALVATETDVGALVVGSSEHAHSGRVLPGGVGDKLLEGARCAIAVAPRGFAGAPDAEGRLRPAEVLRVIELAYDGSEESNAALAIAKTVALAAGATMRVVTVGPRGAGGRESSEAFENVGMRTAVQLQDALQSAVARLPSELRALPIYEQGAPTDVLLDRAAEGIDLIVMGSRGHGAFDTVLLGSTARSVIAAAPCPVLVVPRPAI